MWGVPTGIETDRVIRTAEAARRAEWHAEDEMDRNDPTQDLAGRDAGAGEGAPSRAVGPSTDADERVDGGLEGIR